MTRLEARPPTALQRHATFFDPNADHAIGRTEVRRGLAALGIARPFAAVLAAVIVFFLGRLTRGRYSSSISVAEIHRGKHPFTTDVFDRHGELDETAFARLFAGPHLRAPRDRVTLHEMRALIVARGDPRRPFGLAGSLLSNAFSLAEVALLFCLASDCRKLVGDELLPAISRRTMRRFYEGRLFRLLARRRRLLESAP